MFTALIVEDEPLMRDYLMQNLTAIHSLWETAGCARDGVEAMALLKEKQYDLVITDIKMPRMDGLELAGYLHSNQPDTDIIILTGYGEFDYARAAVRAHAADYLLKPLQDAELLDALNRLAMKRTNGDTAPASLDLPEHPAARTADGDPSVLVQRARAYVQMHFSEPLSLNEVADTLGVNPAYLSSIFKSERGESYSKFILRLRMERAALLLQTYAAGKIGDIAAEVGYSSTKHFYSVFKDYFGMTPNEYRSRKKGSDARSGIES